MKHLHKNKLRVHKKVPFLKFKYPKLFILVICILAAYFLFSNPIVQSSINTLQEFRYLGLFVAGMLFAFGFSAPFAVGFFITLQPQSIILAGLIAGMGALFSDILIFRFIKISFMDEFEELKKTKIILNTQKAMNKGFGLRISNYLLYAFAGILIASPLPDEVGVTMLAGLTKIKAYVLATISFILNTFGIIIILLLSA